MESITVYLANLEARLSAIESRVGVSGGAVSAGPSSGAFSAAPAAAAATPSGDTAEELPRIRAYDAYALEFVDPLIVACEKLGADGVTLVCIVTVLYFWES
jgi:hypothetical protein